MDFLDEYKSVMEKYAGLKVFVGAHRNGSQCCIDYGNHSYMRFWCDHGVYCFDIEERGEVRKGGMFNSPSIDLTQKVMLNYTVSILRHALRLSCCTHTCFPTVAHCFGDGLGVRMFGDVLCVSRQEGCASGCDFLNEWNRKEEKDGS